MSKISFTLYSASSGAPLAGLEGSLSFASLRRLNADGTSSDISSSAPSFHGDGGGDYHFDLDDGLLLPGTIIRYVVDATAASAARYYDGEIDAGKAGAVAAGAVEALEEILLHVGDRAPSMLVTLVDGSGQPVDLSGGAPSVVFNMRSDSGGALVVSGGAVTIVDAAAGKVLYPWASAATAAAGQFFAELVLTQGGLQSTFPWGRALVVRVLPRV